MLKIKDWGRTRSIAATPAFSIEEISVEAGGHCSWHLHECKHNTFCVFTGVLVVQWKTLTGLIEQYRLVGPSPHLTVAAGTLHQFEAMTPVEALEIYTPAASGISVDPEDIVRFSAGGIRTRSERLAASYGEKTSEPEKAA